MSTCYVSDEGSQDHTKHLVHICCEWRFSANGEPTCRLVGKERHFVSFVLIEKVSTICQGLFFLLCTLQWNPLTTMWSLSVLHDYLLRNSLAHFPFLYVKQCRQNKKILVRFTYVLFIYLFIFMHSYSIWYLGSHLSAVPLPLEVFREIFFQMLSL